MSQSIEEKIKSLTIYWQELEENGKFSKADAVLKRIEELSKMRVANEGGL